MHTIAQAGYILLNWRVSKWQEEKSCVFQPCKFNFSYLALASINLSLDRKKTHCELITSSGKCYVLRDYTVSLRELVSCTFNLPQCEILQEKNSFDVARIFIPLWNALTFLDSFVVRNPILRYSSFASVWRRTLFIYRYS